MMLYISLPIYTVGLVFEDGVVTDAPPIAKWTIGRPVKQVKKYFRERGATVITVFD